MFIIFIIINNFLLISALKNFTNFIIFIIYFILINFIMIIIFVNFPKISQIFHLEINFFTN